MNEYAALAQRVGLIMDDVRGCLVLSRDGLILAAYPVDHEDDLRPAWLRFVQLGEARKGFVEFGDQIWAFVHRGPYAAFVVAGIGVRPGVLLDQLEQALLAAEDSRTTREPLKLPDAATAPSGKPRTPLHPPAERIVPSEPAAVAAETPGERRQKAPEKAPERGKEKEREREKEKGKWRGKADRDAASAADTAAAEAPPSTLKREPQKLVGDGETPPDEGGEIDRVLLAKEFSGLLQMDSDGDEASG